MDFTGFFSRVLPSQLNQAIHVIISEDWSRSKQGSEDHTDTNRRHLCQWVFISSGGVWQSGPGQMSKTPPAVRKGVPAFLINTAVWEGCDLWRGFRNWAGGSVRCLSKLNLTQCYFVNLIVDLSSAADLRVDSKIKPYKSKTSSSKLLLPNEGKTSAHFVSLSEQSLNTLFFSQWCPRIRRLEEQNCESSDFWICHQRCREERTSKEQKYPASARTSRLDCQIWRPPVAQRCFTSDSWEKSPPHLCQEIQTSVTANSVQKCLLLCHVTKFCSVS